MSLKNKLPALRKLYSIYEEIPENFLDETDIDSYFFYYLLNISTVEGRLLRVSRSSNKNSFTFKVFKFDSSKLKQRYFLAQELTVTKQEVAAVIYQLSDFVEQYKKVKNSNYYRLPTPKNPFGYSFATDDLFCHHVHEIREDPSRHIRLSFRLGLDNNWLFSFKKFNRIGDQFQLVEFIDLHHTEIFKLFTSRSFILSTFCTGSHYNLKTN